MLNNARLRMENRSHILLLHGVTQENLQRLRSQSSRFHNFPTPSNTFKISVDEKGTTTIFLLGMENHSKLETLIFSWILCETIVHRNNTQKSSALKNETSGDNHMFPWRNNCLCVVDFSVPNVKSKKRSLIERTTPVSIPKHETTTHASNHRGKQGQP